MSADDKKNSKGRASQVGAASVGTILIFVAKLESVDPVLGQILIYATPFLTIIAAGSFVLFGEFLQAKILSRKAKNDLDAYILLCDSHLKDESLDEELRTEILSKRNQAKMAAINDRFSQVIKNFPAGVKDDAVKKSNRKSNPSQKSQE